MWKRRKEGPRTFKGVCRLDDHPRIWRTPTQVAHLGCVFSPPSQWSQGGLETGFLKWFPKWKALCPRSPTQELFSTATSSDSPETGKAIFFFRRPLHSGYPVEGCVALLDGYGRRWRAAQITMYVYEWSRDAFSM